MSLAFRYQLFATKKPVVTLSGRWVRPRPTVLISVIGPRGTYVEKAYLDPAADDCVFPNSVATKIGLDLTDVPEGEAADLSAADAPQQGGAPAPAGRSAPAVTVNKKKVVIWTVAIVSADFNGVLKKTRGWRSPDACSPGCSLSDTPRFQWQS